jgi:SSS family solute:Na+ symporter
MIMNDDHPRQFTGKTFALTAAVMILVTVLASGSVCAEEATSGPGVSTVSEQQSGLHWIDWLLIGIYASATIGLGIYFSRRQSSTEEYFVGGGNLNPFLIGVSLFATLLSTISYLSMPGEASGKGPVNLVGYLALPVVFFVVAFGLLPIYMRQRVTSAYQLLEERLGLSVRLLGATMFLALRLVWMTLLVYLAAKAMTVMIGVDFWVIHFEDFAIDAVRFGETVNPDKELPGIMRLDGQELRVAAVPVIVLFTGLVSVTYTTLGGLRAVVVTDFMQTCLLFGGALLVLATVTWDFGGFGWFPTTWHESWDTQPFFSFDPKTRVTVVGTFLTITTWYIATSGGDQTSVQRFMATRDVSSARRALATQLCVAAVVGLTLYFVGFALLGYFEKNPGQLPADMGVKKNADDLFPRFIAYQLPIGVSGVVVAAMFAAAMSSIDSGVNSITAVVMTDYLDRFGFKPKSEKGHVRTAQLLALGIGVTVVVGSVFMKYIEGNITAVTSKTVNLLTTPIFALFFFAVFVPFARPLGVWIGAFFGTITAAVIAFSGPLVYFLYVHYDIDPAAFGVELITKTDKATGDQWTTAEDPISFQWIGPVAILVNITVGTSVSWLLSRIRPKPKKAAKSSGDK